MKTFEIQRLCRLPGILLVCLVALRAHSGIIFTNLVKFAKTTGRECSGELVQGIDGNFYGTTAYAAKDGNLPYGGGNGEGNVFRMTPAGAFTNLVFFNGTN